MTREVYRPINKVNNIRMHNSRVFFAMRLLFWELSFIILSIFSEGVATGGIEPQTFLCPTCAVASLIFLYFL